MDKKKEEFLLFAQRALKAEEAGNEAAYLFNLKIAMELLEEVEGKT